MEKQLLEIMKITLVSVLLIVCFTYAGRQDYVDNVMAEISQNQCEVIMKKLGGKVSNDKVVEEFVSHRDYYESLK